MHIKLLELPSEMIDRIFTFTDDKSKLKLRAVCKETRRQIDDSAMNPNRKPAVSIQITAPMMMNDKGYLVTDPSKSTAFALKLTSTDYPIFLIPMMNFFSSREFTFLEFLQLREKYCAELGKCEMLALLGALRVPLNGCKLDLESTLAERAGECLEIVETCYKMFPIDTLTIKLWQPLPEMDLLANKIALDIKPRRIDLKMEITTPSLNFIRKIAETTSEIGVDTNIFGKHCCYLTINETFEAGEIEMLINELVKLKKKKLHFEVVAVGMEERNETIGNLTVTIKNYPRETEEDVGYRYLHRYLPYRNFSRVRPRSVQ